MWKIWLWEMLFRSIYKHFEFLVMLFGLKNATSALLDLVNWVYKPFLDNLVIVFIDDILVYTTIKKKDKNI